jgi:hypothetical protein
VSDSIHLPDALALPFHFRFSEFPISELIAAKGDSNSCFCFTATLNNHKDHWEVGSLASVNPVDGTWRPPLSHT